MSTLHELAARITSKVEQVEQLLTGHDLPQPTLDEAGGIDTSQAKLDPLDLIAARNDLINAAQDIIRLAQGPIDHLMSLSYTGVDVGNFASILEMKVPQAVPLGDTISLPELASKTGFDEDLLARIVRYGITNGIFVEPSPGTIGHSAASATIAKSKAARDVLLFNTGMITSIVTNTHRWLSRQKDPRAGSLKGEPPVAAFNIAYPGWTDLFEYMNKNPDEAQRYFNFLNGRSDLPRHHTENLKRDWDWPRKLGTGTMVDVGGSSGRTSMFLAGVASSAKFVVQDINPEAISMGEALVAKDPLLKDRVSFQPHDFFQPQTLRADVYFFRHILHDWSDEACVKILRALEPALRTGAKVLVSEGLIPESPSRRSALLEDRQVRIEDQVMMGTHLAKERSLDEFKTLFATANPRWIHVGTTGATVAGMAGVMHSLIEFEWSADQNDLESGSDASLLGLKRKRSLSGSDSPTSEQRSAQI